MAVVLLSLDTMATQKSTKTAQNESEACHSSFSLNPGPICLSATSLESLLVKQDSQEVYLSTCLKYDIQSD